MDVQRIRNSPLDRLKKYRLPAIGLASVVFMSVAISAYSPSAPTVQARELLIGEVQRGDFRRQVRGPGTLISNQVRWISARTEGRVEQIHKMTGSMVTADTVLLELSNPDLEQSARTAKLALIAAEAEYKALIAELAEAALAQEVRLLEAKTGLEQASFRYDAELLLAEDNIIAGVDLNESRLSVTQFRARLALEEKRSTAMPELHQSRREAGEARVAQFREAYDLQLDLVNGLKVRAGIDGVLQALPLEQGQQIISGTILARVANPADLRAELLIPEVQAKDIRLGQLVTVDVRDGSVEGKVSRLDPAVEGGTVAVDVSFTDGLPQSARIDQSVDGAIELDLFRNALYVERPVQVSTNAYASLFLVGDNGDAVRTSVRTGSSSVLHLQILEGLVEGDRIVLSDMSRFSEHDLLLLE